MALDNNKQKKKRKKKITSLALEVRYLHKVSFLLELDNGLEDQSPATHPQQTAGVLAVGKHSSYRKTQQQSEVETQERASVVDFLLANIQC